MIRIHTFGFRNGAPQDKSVFVFDCRKLRNPHFVNDLRDLDGRDEKVQCYVLKDPDFNDLFTEAMFHALSYERPQIAFGCFGGKHRSVAAAELLAKELRAKGLAIEVTHKELAAT